MAVQADLVLGLLISNESNPRSVAFQVAALSHQIHRLQEREHDFGNSPEQGIVRKVLDSLRSTPMADISRREPDGSYASLDKLVGSLKTGLWELSDALTAQYFSNLTACRFTASW